MYFGKGFNENSVIFSTQNNLNQNNNLNNYYNSSNPNIGLNSNNQKQLFSSAINANIEKELNNDFEELKPGVSELKPNRVSSIKKVSSLNSKRDIRSDLINEVRSNFNIIIYLLLLFQFLDKQNKIFEELKNLKREMEVLFQFKERNKLQNVSNIYNTHLIIQ